MALRDINLVPFEMLAGRRWRRHAAIWAVCATVVFSSILSLRFYQHRKAMALRHPSADLTKMEMDLASRIERIKGLLAEYEKLKTRYSDVKRVTTVLPCTQVLSHLERAMNQYTWLSSLEMERGKEKQSGIVLRLTGFSLRNEELGDFLTGLSRDPLFRQASLRHAKEANVLAQDSVAKDRLNGVQFEIECNISNPG